MLQKKTAVNILETKPAFSGRKKERKRCRSVNRNRDTLRIK
jgi:hypothetical protein